MRSAWRKVQTQNHLRSLDHRANGFKTEDKKRRAPKQLLAEVLLIDDGSSRPWWVREGFFFLCVVQPGLAV